MWNLWFWRTSHVELQEGSGPRLGSQPGYFCAGDCCDALSLCDWCHWYMSSVWTLVGHNVRWTISPSLSMEQEQKFNIACQLLPSETDGFCLFWLMVMWSSAQFWPQKEGFKCLSTSSAIAWLSVWTVCGTVTDSLFGTWSRICCNAALWIEILIQSSTHL